MDKMTMYAEIMIKIGINLQKGQELIISAPVESLDFVRVLTDVAYLAGASIVTTQFSDGYCTRSRFLNSHEEHLDSTQKWMADGMEQAIRSGAARLSVIGDDPTLLKDIDSSKLSIVGKARAKAFYNVSKLVSASHTQWSIAAYPTKAWASKVFPDIPVDEAVNRLWDEIYRACRIDGHPIKNWDDHNIKLHQIRDKMNKENYDGLHFDGPTANLYVGLADGHIWEAGAATAKNGIVFNANIPTEEIYTTPKRHDVSGWVSSTKPLFYRGQKIDGIQVVFEKGKAIDVKASIGEDILKNMISSDDGASFLGEVALVPVSSPINKTGIIFQETLFDENAASHLAFGASYDSCISEIPNETPEQKLNRGANASMIHTDWMIGSSDMTVYGVKDGKETKIMENGEWV